MVDDDKLFGADEDDELDTEIPEDDDLEDDDLEIPDDEEDEDDDDLDPKHLNSLGFGIEEDDDVL